MRPPDRKRFNLFHLSIAVAAFAVFLATFRGRGVTELDLGLFLGCGLFPMLLTIVFPYNPHVDPNMGAHDPDPNLLRGVCCSSAEIVAFQMVFWRLEVSQRNPRAPSASYSIEINVIISLVLFALAVGTHVAIWLRGYARTWHWLFLWNLVMWVNFEIWVYLHST